MDHGHAYDEVLRQRLTRHLAVHPRHEISTDGLRRAAVAVVVPNISYDLFYFTDGY